MIDTSFNSINKKSQDDRAFEQFSNNAHSKTAIEYKGSLVNENPIKAAASSIKGLKNDVVNLKNAVKDGKSDDHSLGKLNDLGMKLSALAIALFLSTKRSTPKAKLMEFLGAGIFFGMMKLWPKIFIAAPIKARFGVDIHQKYQDSQGKVKELGQDNQYRPNVRTREEKERLADRMGLPKDMEFRGEYAEEKERKITLQGRTLNMLTAGFATPVMTALICGQIEKHIDEPLNRFEMFKAARKAEQLGKKAEMRILNPMFAKGSTDTVIHYLKSESEVNDELFKNLAFAFNPANTNENAKWTKTMPNMSDKLAGELKGMFNSLIDEKAKEDIIGVFTKYSTVADDVFTISAADPENIGNIIKVDITKENLQEAVDNVIVKIKQGKIEYTPEAILKALSIEPNLVETISSAAESLDEDIINMLKEDRIAEIYETATSKEEIAKLIEGVEKGTDAVLLKTMEDAKEATAGVVSNKAVSVIPSDILKGEGKKAFVQTIEQGKKRYSLPFMDLVKENFEYVKQAGATMSVSDDVIKAIDNASGKGYFNIVDIVYNMAPPNEKQLERLRSDADYACDYIQRSLKDIAKDKDKTEKFLQAVTDAPIMEEAKRNSIVNNLIENATKELGRISNDFDPSLRTLKQMTDITTSPTSGLVAYLQKYASETLPGVDATKNRILLAFDLETRINNGSVGRYWKRTIANNSELGKEYTYKKLVDDCRKIIYASTPGDFANTHYIKGNGLYYEFLNNILFNQPMSNDVKDILTNSGNSGLIRKLEEMRVTLMAIGSKGWGNKRTFGDKIAVSDYKNTSNIISDAIIKDEGLKKIFNSTLAETDAVKYQKVGKPLKSFSFENASQLFNSKAWMKAFAPIAVGIVGVTLIAQAFIGRDKEQHLYMRKRKPQGAVNGNK